MAKKEPRPETGTLAGTSFGNVLAKAGLTAETRTVAKAETKAEPDEDDNPFAELPTQAPREARNPATTGRLTEAAKALLKAAQAVQPGATVPSPVLLAVEDGVAVFAISLQHPVATEDHRGAFLTPYRRSMEPVRDVNGTELPDVRLSRAVFVGRPSRKARD